MLLFLITLRKNAKKWTFSKFDPGCIPLQPPPPLYFAEFGALNWGKGKDAVCEDNAKDAVSVVLLPSTTCTTPPPPHIWNGMND